MVEIADSVYYLEADDGAERSGDDMKSTIDCRHSSIAPYRRGCEHRHEIVAGCHMNEIMASSTIHCFLLARITTAPLKLVKVGDFSIIITAKATWRENNNSRLSLKRSPSHDVPDPEGQ